MADPFSGSYAGGSYNGGGGASPNYFNDFGAIGSGIGSLFAQNPANAANQYYNQVPGALNQAYGPYMGYGPWAGGQLQGQIGNLLSNPGGFINQIGAGYQQSPGFQWQLNQALQAGNQAAGAGGMAGSPMAQQNAMTTATGLANQNYQQYMQNALGAYGLGFGGAQNMYGTGAQLAGQYGSDMASSLMNQGNLAYAGAINQNQARAGGIGSILGGIGGLFSGSGGVGGLLNSLTSWL